MADKKFDLVFNASLEVGQVKTAVASLTKSLESAGAKIPQSITTNLNRMIQSLNTELNKLEGMTDIQLDPKNAKNVGKSYEKIFQTFQQIKAALGDIHRTAGIDPEKFFPSEIASNISKAAQAVQKYKKTMEAGIKTEDHSQTTKDIAKAAKEAENLQKKLNEAIMKRDEASNTKQALQDQRAELQAKKEAAEAEVKAAKEAEKAVNDKIDSQKKLAQIEEEIAKKKKKQQEAVNKAAKNNEIKNEREGMKQAKNKGTDTKAYRDAVASYAESTAEVQRLEGEIKQLETQYAQLSQAAVSAGEQAAAIERIDKATDKLKETQASLKKNQSAMDTEDAHYAAAVGEIQTLTPAVRQAEQALEQLRLKKQQLESGFEQSTFDELIQELEKLGIKLPDAERNMEGVERALDELANKAKGEVVSALQSVEKAVEDVETPLKQTGQAAVNFDQMADSAKHAEQDMENLKNQVLDFFSITNTIQIFKNAIRDAFDTVKELDAAMTETAVVTDFSVGDMWEKLPQYSAEATKLGASIKSLYEATTLYYQQGLNSEQAMGVGIETMKMARIANMDAAAATEAMTAALRGFNMEINEMSATRINDVYSELAAITAADTSQIATAMSKTASIAESANMEFEITAALLAQIIETTQEAPETAGTAMKTIIARFTEVKQLFSEGMLTGEDSEGEEININKIDAALKTVGISLKDFLTGAKGIDDIFLELASKWDTLDLATQRYIATTAAGSRQQSRFLAMMGNYDRTMELVNAATNSAGASQKQFGKTLDSLDAKLQKLKNAWDTFTMGLANSEIIKGGVDLLTWILETANKLTEAFDGIGGSVAKIGLAIAALRTGKGIFNLFTGQAYSAGAQAGAKFAAGLVASIKDIPIDQATTNLQNNLKGALSSTVAWSNGLLALGMGLKFAAQQMEDSPYAEYADEVSMAGTAVLGLTSALKILTPIAAAANTTVLGLIKTVIMGMGPWGWAAAAIIAVGGALAYIGHQNSPGQILKKMKENAEEAGTAAEEAAQKYNELKTSLDNLSSSEEALNNLTVGTQEWRDAVVNLNDEILKLIETYPELAELVKFEDGHLTIDYDSDRGQEITKQLHSQVIAKQIASIAADASVVRQEQQVYYYDNIYGFNPLVSQIGAIEDLANAIYHDYSSFDTQEEIIDWLNNNNLKQFAQDEVAVGKLYNNKDKLYDYGKYLEGNQTKYDSYNAVAQSTLISKMDTDDYSNRVVDLLGKIQVPVQDYADSWRENSQVNKSNYQQVGKVLAEELYGEGATVSLNNWNNEVTLSNKEGTESRTMSFDEFKDQAAYYKGSQQAAQQLEEAASLISSMSEKQQDNLDKLISTEGQNMDLTMLKDISLSGGIEQYVSSIFGPEVAQKFESIFGISFEQLESNMQIAMERISKERGALVKKMSKYSSKDLEGYEINANILAGLELKFGERINGILDGVLSSLEKSGDEALITQGFEQFRETAMAGTKEEMEELSSFIQDIDWSNPIEAAHRLNQEISTGTGLTKEYAQNILNAGSSFLSASSQMQYFFKTEDYDAVKEDIDEIIEKNGELSAGDVLDLADEYKTLDKVLKNTKATAGGLAKALELVSKGKLGIYQLTDVVMSALEGFDGLNSMVAGVLKTLSEFDPGMDENEIADFINTAYETLSENIKAGAVGNNQNFSYLDFFFPGWDKGLEGDALVAQMEYLTGKLKDNSVNMRRAWSDMAQGKDIYGQAWQFDEDSGRTADDLKIDDTGSSIKLTGWEGKGMTTQDMVDWIADAYNVSSDYAKMMLGDFKNYSADLAKELNTNDFTAAIENAYEKLRTIKVGDVSAHSVVGKKIIDMSEIEALAELYGKEISEVYAMFDGKAFITDFYDDNGFLQETSVILGQLDKIAQSGGVVGAQWTDRFINASSKNLDVTKLNQGLGEIGIPDSAKAGITQDIVDSMLAASNGQPVYIDVKMSDGVTRAIEVTPEIDVQTAIANAETELANSNLAEAIASAFKNITFSPEINGQDLTDSVIAAIKAADGTLVTILPDQNSLNTISSEIVGAAAESSPIAYVSGNIQDVLNKVASLKLSAECVVTYVEGNTPPGSGGTTGGTTSGTTYENGAIGIKSANYSGTTLVSEEGPELIQKAKGGAYLSGTNGPEMVNIEKGDTVYTAEETKEIFKKRNHRILPRYATGYGSGTAYYGSGGKGPDSDKDDKWENSFDKLYNLVREIDEELRQRERIERRYEKLLESVDLTADKLYDNSVEQLKQLEKEKLLNQELRDLRRQQIYQYQMENAELTKYAKVVQNERGEDVLRIHWDQINQVEDPERGQEIEDYVSQLEEWMEDLNKVEDSLNDIEDRIEEIKEQGKDEYIDLENAIKDAIEFAYQEEIDKLSEINESINDTNTQLINAMSKQLGRIRQQRENERTERELEEKQRQLLYLSQDTSGANDMQILQLQKDIDEQQVDYTDTLIDQKIEELEQQNEEAALQREQQIKILQTQLDYLIQTGQIWDEVYSLMDEGLDYETGLIRGSRLEQMLKNAEGFQGMSKIQQMDWLKELQQQSAQAVTYMRMTNEKLDTSIELDRQNYFGQVTSEPKYNGSSSNNSNSSNSSGKNSNNNNSNNYEGTVNKTPKSYQASYSYGGWSGSASSSTETGARNEITRQIEAKYNAEINRINNLTGVLFSEKTEMKNSAQNKKNRALQSVKVVAQYKKGGLADFTGPAWLDGTKSHPELVLNQKDTQNFIQLKDILASLMTGSHISTENHGDITYDIDINVENISNDYDIEQVANKIKSLINEDARYRNNNAVSLKR